MTREQKAVYGLEKVLVQCVGCKDRRYAEPQEFGPVEVPFCSKCYLPMATVEVVAARKKGKS